MSWGDRGARWCTYTLRSGVRPPLDIQRKCVARFFVVGICVVALCGNTAAVEAGKADIDPLRIVLRGVNKESEAGGTRPN